MSERERYAEYLCSREWAVLRKAVIERARGACERCKLYPGTAVHHLTYVRKYHEDLADLQLLCEHCHEFTHGKSDYDPAAARTPAPPDDFEFDEMDVEEEIDEDFDAPVFFYHNGNHPLRCPSCGGDCVHCNAATDLTFPAKAKEHGVGVEFWCEGCDRNFQLTIVTCKGQTSLEWEIRRRDD